MYVAGESSTVSSGDSNGKVIQAYAELQNKMWQKQAQVVQPTEIRVSLGICVMKVLKKCITNSALFIVSSCQP